MPAFVYNFYFSVLLLLLPSTLCAQSGALIIGVDYIDAVKNIPPRYLATDQTPVSVKIGFMKTLPDNHWRIESNLYADVLSYAYAIDETKNFDGGTLFTGIGAGPHYSFNPNADWIFSVAALVKLGVYTGIGKVFIASTGDYDQYLEQTRKYSSLGLAFSPKILLQHKIGENSSLGIETGWDSTNYGQGLNVLRSSYYKPFNYHSSIIYFGLIATIGTGKVR